MKLTVCAKGLLKSGHMGIRFCILLAVLVLSLLFAFIFWQYTLLKTLQRSPATCGGDWSYNLKCPIGTYCKALDQGTLVGGYCAPYIGVIGLFSVTSEPDAKEPDLHKLPSTNKPAVDRTITPYTSKDSKAGWKTLTGPMSLTYDGRLMTIDYPAKWIPSSHTLTEFTPESPQHIFLSFPARDIPPKASVKMSLYGKNEVKEFNWVSADGPDNQTMIQFLDSEGSPIHCVYFSYNRESDKGFLNTMAIVLASFKVVVSPPPADFPLPSTGQIIVKFKGGYIFDNMTLQQRDNFLLELGNRIGERVTYVRKMSGDSYVLYLHTSSEKEYSDALLKLKDDSVVEVAEADLILHAD